MKNQILKTQTKNVNIFKYFICVFDFWYLIFNLTNNRKEKQ